MSAPPPPAPPRRPPGAPATSPGPRREAFRWGRLLPFVGPLVLFIVWDLVVRAGWIKAILLPTPSATLGALFSGLAGGALLLDFGVTVLRTLRGVPDRRGRRRAARRAARQQRARLPQRRVPDRLLPLDAVIGADPAVPADLRRLRHQQGRDRRLRRAADRRLQQRLRRHQREEAARDGGARDGRVALAGVQGRADLGEPAADLRRPALGGLDGARHRDRRRDVHRLRQRPRPPHHRRAAGAQRKSMYAAILAAGALGYALNVLFLVAERKIVHWSGR